MEKNKLTDKLENIDNLENNGMGENRFTIDENLVLVNKLNKLRDNYIPLDLEYVNIAVDVVDEKKFMKHEAASFLKKCLERLFTKVYIW